MVAGLLAIPDFQLVFIMTKFLTANFLLLLLYLGYAIIKEYFIWVSPSTGSGSLGSSFVFSGVILVEVSGVGNTVLGDNRMVDIQLFLEASLNMPLGSDCFIDGSFFW
jgi:hypothetical protein